MTERPDCLLRRPERGGSLATDALSDVLRTVRLSGALFFLMDVTAPWEAEVPDGAMLASSVLPGAQHVISYHVATQQRGR